MAEKTIVNYDQIANIGKLFEQEGETVANLEMKLRQKAQDLESEWIGEGATKFFNEFFQDVLPGLVRLHEACALVAQTIRVVSEIFNEAEEETEGYFKEGALEGGEGSGIDVGGLEFSPFGSGGSGLEEEIGQAPISEEPLDGGPNSSDLPPTGDGEQGDLNVSPELDEELNEAPITEEPMDYEEMNEPVSAASAGTGGGGGGSSAGSQGMQGNLEMGVGSSSQVSGGPGAEPSGAGGGAGMQDHVYQSAAQPSGSAAGGANSPQTAGQAAAQPSQQTGIGDAAGAAGALGGAGAAAGVGTAAAKKLKEKKDEE